MNFSNWFFFVLWKPKDHRLCPSLGEQSTYFQKPHAAEIEAEEEVVLSDLDKGISINQKLST